MAQASSSRIVMGRVSITSFFCSREDRMRGKRDRGATHIFLSALAPPVPPRDGSASCSHAAAGPPLEPRQLSEFMHELAMSWPNLSGTGPTAAMCEVTISEAACASACKIVVQIFIWAARAQHFNKLNVPFLACEAFNLHEASYILTHPKTQFFANLIVDPLDRVPKSDPVSDLPRQWMRNPGVWCANMVKESTQMIA